MNHKQNDGMDAKLGGYPTPLDVGYPFEYPAVSKRGPPEGRPEYGAEQASPAPEEAWGVAPS